MKAYIRRLGPLFVLVALGVGAEAIEGCGGGASCEAGCSNIYDLCTDGTYSEVEFNNCVEQCNERVNVVPEQCNDQRDAVLSCVANAATLNCSDPQQSAECADENAALATCLAGPSPSPSGGTGGAGGASSTSTATMTAPASTGSGPTPVGSPCQRDADCVSNLCNEETNSCSTPGVVGAPCFRDEECQSHLCNQQTDICAQVGGLGSPCFRDDECSGHLCNQETQFCAQPAGFGMPCFRDLECLSGQCDPDSSVCL